MCESIKTMEELKDQNKELEYRLSRCVELLKVAKCPANCTGNCAWCYEREIEIRAHKL